MGNELLNSIEITITFRDRNGNHGILNVIPEDFFEIDDAIEAITTIREFVWRHSHASNYIGLSPAQLIETTIKLSCHLTNERIEDSELYWSAGTCRTVFRQEFVDDRNVYWVRIVEIGTPSGIHFIRFGSDSAESCDLLEHHFVSPAEEVAFLFPEAQEPRS